MGIEQAFDRIAGMLAEARDRGIKPSIRVAREEWVCTIDDKQTKINIIAKEGELLLVDMDLKKGKPDIQRFKAPEYSRQEIVQRIEKVIKEVT